MAPPQRPRVMAASTAPDPSEGGDREHRWFDKALKRSRRLEREEKVLQVSLIGERALRRPPAAAAILGPTDARAPASIAPAASLERPRRT